MGHCKRLHDVVCRREKIVNIMCAIVSEASKFSLFGFVTLLCYREKKITGQTIDKSPVFSNRAKVHGHRTIPSACFK